MTNAEKYLKDGVKTRDFIDNMFSSQYPEEFEETLYIDKASIICWLNNPAKPTLTEVERVILRNLDCRYNKIRKVKEPNHLQLQVFDQYDKKWEIFPFNHIFQFITERRRIRDKGVIKRK